MGKQFENAESRQLIFSNYTNRHYLLRTKNKDKKNDEFTIKTPYTVETETGRVIVYVTLIKCDEEWYATSLEVIEVIPNE